jgi:hypothetical protein
MHVEAPEAEHSHHPFGSFRDFTLHILTISLGLGLALGGEAFVEYLDHRELAQETREAFRTQIEVNRKAVEDHLSATTEIQAALAKAITLADTDFTGAKKVLLDAPHKVLELDSGSWDPAVATGALNYMKLAEVRAYSQIHVRELALNKLNLENESVWAQLAEFNEGTLEFDKGDLRAVKRLLRESTAYSKWISVREQELLKMYDGAEK